ncbi:hypothetical protein LO772_08445 [Yinghuangia sp. ASG 101]|uniref:hypothetical protein n=1 Tax=Yinghuangia sp. ASG 101 TaxID=2896848 RepID=UPI001E54BC47|nr:hypothetical protein [Yinghuangia sp. ASG 101]UGQ13616.1 hypothetical protein LO772_08445 [Yinghuangia sp. ASG 101]
MGARESEEHFGVLVFGQDQDLRQPDRRSDDHGDAFGAFIGADAHDVLPLDVMRVALVSAENE